MTRLIALLFFVALPVFARQAPAPGAAPIPLPPLVDPAKELKGRALVDALRGGGYVLYMRHALQIPPTLGPCMGSNLKPEGEEQAKRVGAAIRALKIPVGRLLSSEACRNIDTAKLLGLGKYELAVPLNPMGLPPGYDPTEDRVKLLGEPAPKGSNTLLVSHVHGAKDKKHWMHLDLAEVIVYKPAGGKAGAPVARVKVEEWEGLEKAVR